MTRPYDIDQLLEKYYDGATTPDEDLTLLILLQSIQDDSPYVSDRQLLESSLVVSEHMEHPSYTISSTDDALPRQRSWSLWIRRASVAAAVALIVGVGLTLQYRGEDLPEYSLYNGTPLAQEQVNDYTQAAFARLSSCMAVYSEQQDKMDQAFSSLQHTYRTSLNKIPLQHFRNTDDL